MTAPLQNICRKIKHPAKWTLKKRAWRKKWAMTVRQNCITWCDLQLLVTHKWEAKTLGGHNWKPRGQKWAMDQRRKRNSGEETTVATAPVIRKHQRTFHYSHAYTQKAKRRNTRTLLLCNPFISQIQKLCVTSQLLLCTEMRVGGEIR